MVGIVCTTLGVEPAQQGAATPPQQTSPEVANAERALNRAEPKRTIAATSHGRAPSLKLVSTKKLGELMVQLSIDRKSVV